MGYSKDLKASQNVKTLAGRKVLVESSSDGVTVNRNSKVVAADNAATNGVVHVIDTVLLPPNIVDLAQGNADLSTLVTALTAGKLVSALQGTGPFTVFAPSNAAFAKLPQQELTRLLDVDNVDDLVSILKYHVVSTVTPRLLRPITLPLTAWCTLST